MFSIQHVNSFFQVHVIYLDIKSTFKDNTKFYFEPLFSFKNILKFSFG